MFTKVDESYYGEFRRENETLLETVNRIDHKIIDDNFKWVCDRDILVSDVIFNCRESNNTKVIEWKSRQEFTDWKWYWGVYYSKFFPHAGYL